MDFSASKRLINHTNNLDLALAINQREFPIINKKRRSDMYHIIEDTYTPELIDILDITSSIIIAAPNEYNNIKRDEFGNLNITTDRKIDVSNLQIINENAVLYFFPKIKVLYPKGLSLDFKIPYDTNFIWNFYHDHQIVHRHSTDDTIPDYHIFTKLSFAVYIDIKRLKKMKNVLTVNKGTSIVSMSFSPKYYVGDPEFANISNVYLIRNNEFVKNLDDMY